MKINFRQRSVSGPAAGSDKGFTLLELMVVAGILVIAITGTLSTFVNASLLNQANRNKAIAANDASYVLEKLKRTPYSQLASYTDANFTGLDNESIAVTVTTLSNAKNVVANVTWTEREAERSFSLGTQVAF